MLLPIFITPKGDLVPLEWSLLKWVYFFSSPPSPPFHFAFSFFKNFVILFLAVWVFVAACRLSLVAESGGYSLLWSTGSRYVGFSSCGMQAQ